MSFSHSLTRQLYSVKKLQLFVIGLRVPIIHHFQGATPLGLDELVKRMDQFDFTEGIYLRQESGG